MPKKTKKQSIQSSNLIKSDDKIERVEKLDVKDRKFLFALWKNGRITTTALAKQIGVSQEVALYRMQRLKDRKILRGVTALIDESVYDFDIYQLYIRFKPTEKSKKEEFLQYAKKLTGFRKAILLAGPYDIALYFRVWCAVEFNELQEQLFKKFGTIVQKKDLSLIIKTTHLPPSMLFPQARPEYVVGGKRGEQKITESDETILELLRNDGRMTILDLAKNTTLAPNTIRSALQRFEQEEVIKGYLPTYDLRPLGYDRFSVAIELDNPAEKTKCAQLLNNHHHVTKIIELFGKSDLEFECYFLTVEDLLEFIEHLKLHIRLDNTTIMFKNQEA